MKDSRKRRADERLKELLDKEHDKDSVGFQLIASMGYEEGKGLGKNLDGLSEAIKPVVRKHRKGLGHDDEKEVKVGLKDTKYGILSIPFHFLVHLKYAFLGILIHRSRYKVPRVEDVTFNSIYRAKAEESLREGFREATQRRFRERQETDDLHRLTVSVEQLDAAAEVEVHPIAAQVRKEEQAPAGNENDDDTDQADTSQHLQDNPILTEIALTDLIHYARNQHHFCLYCGIKFQSAQELTNECPGETRNDH